MTPAMRATVAEVSRHRCVPSNLEPNQAEASHVQAQASQKFEAIDLFCGFGGVTEGLKRAGLEVVLGVEWDARAVRAHRAAHPDVRVTQRDVSHVRPSELAGRFVWASPSCRPWSMANTTGPRGQDHPEYFPLVRLLHQALGARVLVIENVPGLLWSAVGRAELDRLEAECRRLKISCQILDLQASIFGNSQSRRRLFVVIGAGLIFVPDAFSPVASTHGTVTTRSSGEVSYLAGLQGLTNPETLTVPDWRSGRRSSRSHVAVAGPSTARRLIGNAIPPEVAEGVARAVLAAVAHD